MQGEKTPLEKVSVECGRHFSPEESDYSVFFNTCLTDCDGNF